MYLDLILIGERPFDKYFRQLPKLISAAFALEQFLPHLDESSFVIRFYAEFSDQWYNTVNRRQRHLVSSSAQLLRL